MKKRLNIGTGTEWENQVGYSRAVRIGHIIEVAGTTATDGDEILFPGLAYEQTQYVLLKIEQSLKDAGASLEDVVRTRIFTTNIILWEEIGRAHGEVFSEIKPACTMVEVCGLIDDRLIVEIEATAIVGE